jgi:two-component system, cell cycle response regulator
VDRARVVLLEPDEVRRKVLVGRLRAQAFDVDAFGDASEAANWILSEPPQAVVADLWGSGVSGVQLCRLLRAEQATEHVPVLLRAEGYSPRAEFWAEQAGAAAYVPKGRIGDLVRALNRAIAQTPQTEAFFTQLGQVDVRDRIAMHLDRALFESVIASSVRALGTCESLPRLFDRFSQFVCRMGPYHWLALHLVSGDRLLVHCHPEGRDESLVMARQTIGCQGKDLTAIEDEDAFPAAEGSGPLVSHIEFGSTLLGSLALLPTAADNDLAPTLQLIARELGGPLRIVLLMEESQRLACHDPLTGIMNRRAFVDRLSEHLTAAAPRAQPLCFILLDVDHFKLVNDTFGHRAGDRVLTELGATIQRVVPTEAIVARWGGEEFVVALPEMGLDGALTIAERLRATVEARQSRTDEGVQISVTISLGVARWLPQEPLECLVERADHAMYAAKMGGRNRIERAIEQVRILPPSFVGVGSIAPRSVGRHAGL